MQSYWITVEEHKHLIASGSSITDDDFSEPSLKLVDCRNPVRSQPVVQIYLESHFASFCVSSPLEDDCFIGGSLQNGFIIIFKLSDLLHSEEPKPHFYAPSPKTEPIIAITPFDGGKLLSAEDSKLYVWDISQPSTDDVSPIAEVTFSGRCQAMTFNLNPKVSRIAAIACTDDTPKSTVCVFDLSKNQIIMKLDLGSAVPTCLCWSPEVSTQLAVGVHGDHPSVQLWSMRNRAAPMAVESIESVPTALSWFSKDFRFLLAGDRAGHVHLVSVTPTSLTSLGIAEKIESNTGSASITSLSTTGLLSGAAVVSSESKTLVTPCVAVKGMVKNLPDWVINKPEGSLTAVDESMSVVVAGSNAKFDRHWLPLSGKAVEELLGLVDHFTSKNTEALLNLVDQDYFGSFLFQKFVHQLDDKSAILTALGLLPEVNAPLPVQEEHSPMTMDDDADFFENISVHSVESVEEPTSKMEISPEVKDNFIKMIALGDVEGAYELALTSGLLVQAACLWMVLNRVEPEARLIEKFDDVLDNVFLSCFLTRNYEPLIEKIDEENWKFVLAFLVNHSVNEDVKNYLELFVAKVVELEEITDGVIELILMFSRDFDKLIDLWKREYSSSVELFTRTALLLSYDPNARTNQSVNQVLHQVADLVGRFGYEHQRNQLVERPVVNPVVVPQLPREEKKPTKEERKPVARPPVQPPHPVQATYISEPSPHDLPPHPRVPSRPPSMRPPSMTPPTATPAPGVSRSPEVVENYSKPTEIINNVDKSNILPNFSPAADSIIRIVSSFSNKPIPKSKLQRVDSAAQKASELLKVLNERNVRIDFADDLGRCLSLLEQRNFPAAQKLLSKLPIEVKGSLNILSSTLKQLEK
ncbi:hypothetical protein P9112_004341 [Eukaryota sp. TZLM1-RC]